ncbi:glycosyltransferase family 9 protein [Ramlibacter sp.]|uniref:glycosyltransferase family 9 protein n=1 Tax=Ramlibacter sp. TaxID=1917967 RepID=UPI0018092838|nr:glycosyltransferase family 9 protein [Ramlibacter sp.]MBA2675865.1 glycosyltransferase family 9 protein [Ramlibacter sp.]
MRSVLVVVTRQIGDVLLTTPLVREARRLWPDAQIDVLGLEGTLGMLRGNPDIRVLIPMPQRPKPADVLGFTRHLWRRYDLALVADTGDRAHLIGWIAARQRAGVLPAENGSNWWKRRLLTHAVTAGGDLGEVHIVEEKLKLLAPWQAAAGGAVQQPVIAPKAELVPEELRQRLKPGYVVMHTPSMWPYKQWPVAHFRTLAALLVDAGRQVVLTGGPGASDRETVAMMEGAAPEDLLVDAGLLNFNQLAGLLQSAALYIGPDTSVSHLAAACGAPVLAIFGPTNPQRWAPWPSTIGEQPVRFVRRAATQTVGNVTLMQAELPCVPCGKAGCEDHRLSRTDCLPMITPQRVALRALELLGSARR